MAGRPPSSGPTTPCGRSRCRAASMCVRFSYEPASLRIGTAVSAAALIAWSALVIVASKRRRLTQLRGAEPA